MMAIDRDKLAATSESEIQHRYAHALLKPAGFYFVYDDVEAKKLAPTQCFKFKPTFGKKTAMKAIFTLAKEQVGWLYRLTEIQ
jgi:hypothetical protein